MSSGNANDQIERALDDLRQYLSDQLAPLIVADSIELLLQLPPNLMAANIHSWVSGQYRVTTGLPASDYFFHAMKKIHMMGEYNLIPPAELRVFLDKLKPHILGYCPPAERDSLSKSLDGMDDAAPSISSPVEVVYRQSASEAPRSVQEQLVPKTDPEARRIGLLLQRIRQDAQRISSGDASGQDARELSEALAQAARSARQSMELEEALEYVKRLGVQTGTQDVFRALGRNMPEWTLPPTIQLPEDSNLKAMRRIVTGTTDRKESATRFHQMVKTAIERLNEGHLQQAGSMIDLAEKIIEAKEVDPNVVTNLRIRGHDGLDLENLKKFAETPEQHAQLKKVMSFFEALNAPGLLDALRHETKRDRRRLLLSLLESQGEAARVAAYRLLQAPISANMQDEEAFFRRNLLYLLRRIPSSASENQDELIQQIAKHTELSYSPVLVKEAILFLGQIKHRESEKILTELLLETETLLLSTKSEKESGQWIQILDRIAASLARLGTPNARKTLVEHAFSKKARFGNTMNRLTELSSQDLSSDPLLVNRLLTALNASLPKKMLGFVLQNREQDLSSLVMALSGTPMPSVQQTMSDLIQRFPESPASHIAAKIFHEQQQQIISPRKSAPASPTSPSTPVSVSSLSGDLEVFGLPGLFQNLSDHAVTGTLVLKNPDNTNFGSVDLVNGRLSQCKMAHLDGETALFALLERPRPGTFHFNRSANAQEGLGLEFLPLIMEGIRRYDELHQSVTLLPDHARLTANSQQPVPLPDEKDGLLFRELWTAVRNGATAIECESKVTTDPYRVRRLLVHWLETGCLKTS